MFARQVAKVIAIHARALGSLGEVAVVTRDELLDVPALESVDRALFGSAKRDRRVEELGAERGDGRGLGDVLPQPWLAEQDRPLDGAAQLAHVAQPGLSREIGDEIGGWRGGAVGSAT